MQARCGGMIIAPSCKQDAPPCRGSSPSRTLRLGPSTLRCARSLCTARGAPPARQHPLPSPLRASRCCLRTELLGSRIVRHEQERQFLLLIHGTASGLCQPSHTTQSSPQDDRRRRRLRLLCSRGPFRLVLTALPCRRFGARRGPQSLWVPWLHPAGPPGGLCGGHALSGRRGRGAALLQQPWVLLPAASLGRAAREEEAAEVIRNGAAGNIACGGNEALKRKLQVLMSF